MSVLLVDITFPVPFFSSLGGCPVGGGALVLGTEVRRPGVVWRLLRGADVVVVVVVLIIAIILSATIILLLLLVESTATGVVLLVICFSGGHFGVLMH